MAPQLQQDAADLIWCDDDRAAPIVGKLSRLHGNDRDTSESARQHDGLSRNVLRSIAREQLDYRYGRDTSCYQGLAFADHHDPVVEALQNVEYRAFLNQNQTDDDFEWRAMMTLAPGDVDTVDVDTVTEEKRSKDGKKDDDDGKNFPCPAGAKKFAYV